MTALGKLLIAISALYFSLPLPRVKWDELMWVADGDGVGDGGGFGFVLGQVSPTVSHYTWLWRVIRPRRAAADGLGWAGPGGGLSVI